MAIVLALPSVMSSGPRLASVAENAGPRVVGRKFPASGPTPAMPTKCVTGYPAGVVAGPRAGLMTSGSGRRVTAWFRAPFQS